MAKIEEKVEQVLEKPITDLGYELYDVEYSKEAKNYFLRIYIDKPNGIDLNDCEIVNNAITDLLDEADYIKEQYFLEVSSPGIERILRKDKHLQQNLGETIEVKLFSPRDGKKVLEGILQSFTIDRLELIIDNQTVSLERKNIAQLKKKYEW